MPSPCFHEDTWKADTAHLQASKWESMEENNCFWEFAKSAFSFPSLQFLYSPTNKNTNKSLLSSWKKRVNRAAYRWDTGRAPECPRPSGLHRAHLSERVTGGTSIAHTVQIPGAVGEAKAAGSDAQPVLQQMTAGTRASDTSLSKIHVCVHTHFKA